MEFSSCARGARSAILTQLDKSTSPDDAAPNAQVLYQSLKRSDCSFMASQLSVKANSATMRIVYSAALQIIL